MSEKFTLIEAPLEELNKFPQCLIVKSNDSQLYYDENEKVLKIVPVSKEIEISFDTFFSAFESKKWLKYCNNIKKVFLTLEIQGKFYLEVIHDNGSFDFDHSFEGEYILYRNFFNFKTLNKVQIPLDELILKDRNGIVYAKIKILNPDEFRLKSYKIEAELTEKPNNDFKIAVITVTYNRPIAINRKIEFFKKLKRQVKNFDFFIIDNGTFSINKDSLPDYITYIKNKKNVGGTGGFTRGIIEAMKRNYDYVILTDDDAFYLQESFLRICRFLQISRFNGVVGGGILKLEQPNKFIEFGASYLGLFNIKSKNNHYLFNDACEKNNLVIASIEDHVNYIAWTLAVYSKEYIKSFKLPFPFFIAMDDIEYCLRSPKVLPLLGVAAFHYSYSKRYFSNYVSGYFFIRNQLIVNAIYKYKTSIRTIFRLLFMPNTYFNYRIGEIAFKAIKDFLKGPHFLIEKSPQELLEELKQIDNKYQKFNSQMFSIERYIKIRKKRNKNSISKIWKKLLFKITLNGHLIPSFFIKNAQNPYDEGWGIDSIWSKREELIFGKSKMVYYEPSLNIGDYREFNRKLFFKNLFKSIYILGKYILLRKRVIHQYKEMYSYLTSLEFWEKYLELNSNTEKGDMNV